MSHPEQRKFCKDVKRKFPRHFRKCNVVDVGSLDVNGSNRELFDSCKYIGIDVFKGNNVDVVGPAHKMIPLVASHLRLWLEKHYRNRIQYNGQMIDTIISTEALEHDQYFPQTLLAMYEHLRPGGLLVITAAGVGRPEHGTKDHRPEDSPGTTDYYRNVDNYEFQLWLNPQMFEEYFICQSKANKDFQFYGIKKGDPPSITFVPALTKAEKPTLIKRSKRAFIRTKVYIDRARVYMQYVQLFMIVFLFLQSLKGTVAGTWIFANPWISFPIAFLLFLIAFILVGWIDVKFGILKAENRKMMEENPVIMEMHESIKSIAHKLNNS